MLAFGNTHAFHAPLADHGPLLVGCAGGSPSPVLRMEELPDNPKCTLLSAESYCMSFFADFLQLSRIPTVGGPAIPILDFIGAIRYLRHSDVILWEGYQKVCSPVKHLPPFLNLTTYLYRSTAMVPSSIAMRMVGTS